MPQSKDRKAMPLLVQCLCRVTLEKICHQQLKVNGIWILGQHSGLHVELDLGRYVGWGEKLEERKLHAENNK